MKRIKRTIILVLTLMFPLIVEAAGSASISASGSVENGNNVTATITLKNVAAWNLKANGSGATSGCSIHEVGDSGNGNNTTKYFKITCKATKVGTITFSYSGDVTSSDGSNTNISGSKKVNVVNPREKSSNNNLKSLEIEGYTLTPEFNKDVLEYVVELPADATKIKINANKEDGYSSLEGTGEKEVQEGENRLEITVTSETGKSKIYVVVANVKDSNPITREIAGQTLTVIKRASSLSKPDNFEESTITIEETKIPAFYNEITNTTLIGLKDETGTANLYIYDKSNDSYIKYQALTSTVITIITKEPKEIPKNYQQVTLNLEENTYQAYQSSKNKEYYLIYGVDVKTGTENWYSYHKTDNTLQVYNIQELNSLTTNHQEEIAKYKIFIIIFISISAVLLVIILVLVVCLIRKNRRDKMLKKITEKEDNEE